LKRVQSELLYYFGAALDDVSFGRKSSALLFRRRSDDGTEHPDHHTLFFNKRVQDGSHLGTRYTC
jgi:hypothetical protein